MSAAVKRKPSSSSSHSRSTEFLHEDRDTKYKEPMFRHGDLLLTAQAPSVLVMLAFGGRPTLVTVCFGCMFSYIFDILGAMEATILCVTVTLMGIWGSLLYSGRHLLEESLMNLPMLSVLTFVLFLLFFTLTGMFRGLRTEFGNVFYTLEIFLFAIIPLLNASVVSWFVSVEFPMIDLAFSFSTCYYIFLVVLAYPRMSSNPIPSRRDKAANKFVLSFPVLYSMYLIPIIMSPLLFVTLHHNVSMTSLHRVVGFMISVFYPLLLVILAAERHTEYYPDNYRKEIVDFLFIGKVFSCLGIVIMFQSNDIIEEVKFFSGLGEPVASLTIIISAGLLLLSALLKNLRIMYDTERTLEDTDAMGRSISNAYQKEGYLNSSILTVLIEGCYIGAVLIIYLILGIISSNNGMVDNVTSVVTVFVGCWCLAEYYEQQKSRRSVVTASSQIKNLICILAAGACAAYGMKAFTNKHLRFLDFTLEWSFGTIHLQSLCTFSAILTGGAVMIPAMLRNPNPSATPTTLGFIPGSQGYAENDTSGGLINVKTAETYASLLFVIFSLGMSGFELLLREQDWTEVAGGVTSAEVYPSYFLAATAIMFLLTTLHLCSVGSVGIATLWVVGLTQCCKMLHLIDFSSEVCFCVLSLLISLTQPFVLYIREGWTEVSNTAADVVSGVGSAVVWTPRIGGSEFVWYLVMCRLSCDLAARSFLPSIMAEIGGREVTTLQSFALGWALWFFFCAAMSFCFMRESATTQSVCCLAGGVCFMVAGNLLGTFNITYDASSPFYFTFEIVEDEMAGTGRGVDQGGIYAAMSAVFCMVAFLGLMPLKTAVQRMLYLFCFSYCAAMTCYYWAFPEIANADGHHIVSLDKDSLFTFPWLHCFLSVLFSTSVVLNISSPGRAGGWVLTLSASLPIWFTCFAAFSEEHEHYLSGTFFLNMAVQSTTAICSRLVEFARQNSPYNLSTNPQQSTASTSFAETVCMISSVLAFSFGLMYCLFSHHIVCDFAVPLLSLVFATSLEFGWTTSGYVSALYWTLSALYSLFVKDYDGLEFLHEFATPLNGRKGIFVDSDVSMWSKELRDGGYAWLTWIHVMLLVLALGPVIMLVYRRYASMRNSQFNLRQASYDGSDDVLFVFTIISIIPLITAQIWSIRLLGLLGVIFGVCNAYQLGQKQRRSHGAI